MKDLKQFKTLVDLIVFFNDEQACRDYLANIRWSGEPVCPYCKANHVFKFSNGKVFKCGDCKKQFSVRVGTIFEDSKIPLQKWFAAIYLISSHKKGISSLQLHRELGITQKTAWFMLHKSDEYVRGDVHTQNIENVWSQLKRSIYGCYHSVSVKHLQAYCDESAFRYNTRKKSEDGRFDLMLSNINSHITYNDLINRMVS